MTRKAFIMKLKPGFEAEYRRRHDQIWPELSALIRAAGISNYSIFLDPASLQLFAYQEMSAEAKVQDLASEDLMRRWWDYMADIMETNPDNSPRSLELGEVFHLV